MMSVCPVCGKRFVAHWPEHWVFRRRENYMCSGNCLEIFDTREYRQRVGWIKDYKRRKKGMKRKITLEQKKRAVEIAISGGDKLAYLKSCGAANPSASWWYIRKTLKEKEPELYAQLPAEKEEETKMDLHMAEAPQPVVNLTINAEDLEAATEPEYEPEEMTVTMEGKEVGTIPAEVIRSAMENVDAIRKSLADDRPKPLRYDGFEVTTIRNEFGQFHYDEKFNLLDWTSPDGEEVSFTPECWKIFATEALPKAMAILGAKF